MRKDSFIFLLTVDMERKQASPTASCIGLQTRVRLEAVYTKGYQWEMTEAMQFSSRNSVTHNGDLKSKPPFKILVNNGHSFTSSDFVLRVSNLSNR